MGRTIRTFTGRQFDPWQITPADVTIVDIAHGLARICRFGGQAVGYLSVAEHCVRVAELVIKWGHPELALKALGHDAAEAYMGDVIAPIKHMPEMKILRDLEAVLEAAIFSRFGWGFPLPEDERKLIKAADVAIGNEDGAVWRYAPMRWDHVRSELEFLDFWVAHGGIDLEPVEIGPIR